MFQIFKLFPKLYFGIDDLNGSGGEPAGQPDPQPTGNDPAPNPEPAAASPTDDLEFGSVKIPKSEFEKKAREIYKEEFDSRANRDKWSAENTKRAQEIKSIERDAEAFRRLQADQRPQPTNTVEAKRQAYIEKKSKEFPEVDPRFFQSQYDDMMEIAGVKTRESMTPILEKQSQEWEQAFLKEHPLVKPGTEGYQKLVELLGRGYEPEDAYQIVFKKELMEKEFEDRSKAADAERLRKLKGSPTNSQDGDKPMTGTRSERIWKALEKAGVQRD